MKRLGLYIYSEGSWLLLVYDVRGRPRALRGRVN